MSPEQAEGRPLDARSDIFSFGAVLYEMLSGTRAFAGHTAAQVLSAVLRDDAAATPQAPSAVDRMFDAAFKEPGQSVPDDAGGEGVSGRVRRNLATCSPRSPFCHLPT